MHYPQLRNMDELYHLAKDPGERINLHDSREGRSQLLRLQKELIQLHRETNCEFSLALPDN